MNQGDDIGLWDAAAERYEERLVDGSFWKQDLILWPAVLGLLGDINKRSVVDAGCGPGFLSVQLADRGAHVTAIDGSAEMVALARKRVSAQSKQIEVLHADLCDHLPLPKAAFDAVVCNTVLMDIPTIDTALREFHRVLKPSGCLVFSITHPCFVMWCWERDEAGRRLFKSVDDYLTIRSDTNEFWGPTRHYHRPLTYYFRELHAAGFVVDEFIEPVPTCPRTPELEHAWRIPDFVCIRVLPREEVT